jgi:peptide deformylase
MSVDAQALSLILHPASILKERAVTVDPKDEEVQAVALSMIRIMREHRGAGLAAPQVGLSWRMFVTRDPDDPESAITWINPTLEVVGDEVAVEEEGCLSIPEVRGNIRRSVAIRIKGFDSSGNAVEITSDHAIARVWQHENDHLDGVLIIDKMSAMDRLINRRRLRDLERAK